MPIQDYSSDPDLNVQISGINIAEGCPPSGINNAIRQLMADVKEESEAMAEAITAASSALEAYAETQAAKDEEQDAAIAEAKSSAEVAGQAAANALSSADAVERNLSAELAALEGSLAAVATSGSYADLKDKPAIPATPKAYITATWSSGTSWYRKWSDGWIEQGGTITHSATRSFITTVTFPKAFSNINYTISSTCDDSPWGNTIICISTASYRNKTATTVKIQVSSYADSNSIQAFSWYASGY